MSQDQRGDGWWQASDGLWYPPTEQPAESGFQPQRSNLTTTDDTPWELIRGISGGVLATALVSLICYLIFNEMNVHHWWSGASHPEAPSLLLRRLAPILGTIIIVVALIFTTYWGTDRRHNTSWVTSIFSGLIGVVALWAAFYGATGGELFDDSGSALGWAASLSPAVFGLIIFIVTREGYSRFTPTSPVVGFVLMAVLIAGLITYMSTIYETDKGILGDFFVEDPEKDAEEQRKAACRTERDKLEREIHYQERIGGRADYLATLNGEFHEVVRQSSGWTVVEKVDAQC